MKYFLSSGGAFYTPETIITARLHYRSSWAPVLHAVALWLNSTGFGAGEEKEDIPSAPSKTLALPQGASSTTKTFEDSIKERMHLMLGKETQSHHLWCRAFTVFSSSSCSQEAHLMHTIHQSIHPLS